VLGGGLDKVFDRCDAILSPAAPGPAPLGLGSTGSAVFNGLWTLLGTPAVTLPLFEAQGGLPMGVQMVAAKHMDGRLLRSAQWLMDWATDPKGTTA
jgi:Asp-tRNA(Asn)/Glu-tRNA(Gln) amidotransferase A subunit family amidase